MKEAPGYCLGCDNFVHDNSGLRCTHWHNSDISITDPRISQKSCPIKTEILNAVRHIIEYRGEEFYIVISELDGMPWEIFAEVSTMQNKIDLPYMISSWNFTTRLVTLALKSFPLDKVVRQCYKSSYIKGDLPEIIGTILKRYLKKDE